MWSVCTSNWTVWVFFACSQLAKWWLGCNSPMSTVFYRTGIPWNLRNRNVWPCRTKWSYRLSPDSDRISSQEFISLYFIKFGRGNRELWTIVCERVASSFITSFMEFLYHKPHCSSVNCSPATILQADCAAKKIQTVQLVHTDHMVM